VGENHRRGIVLEAGAHHFARMHAGAIHGAAKQLFERQHAVAIVEIQAGKHLVRQVAQAGGEVVTTFTRIAQRGARGQLLRQAAARQFQGGRDPGPLGRTQTGCADFLILPAEECAKTAGLHEQFAPEGNGVLAAHAATKQNGEQLCIRQGCAAVS
jgi:hypothetical protein